MSKPYSLTPKSYSGQIMLETLIALGVITVGLYAAFTLTISNMTSSDAAVDRFIASQLAREAVEIARSVRDTTWISPEPDLTSMLLNTLSNRLLKGAFNPDTGAYIANVVYAVPFWNTTQATDDCPAMDAWCLQFIAADSTIEKYLGADLNPINNRTNICKIQIGSNFIYAGPNYSQVDCTGEKLPYRRLLKLQPICGLDETGAPVICDNSNAVNAVIGAQIISFIALPVRGGWSVYSTPAALYEWR